MKPIASILLVLSLICYVFLPFYEISFQGSLTGFSFTAGTISQHFTLGNTVFALLPFLTCFFAIGFNTLKSRAWGVLVALLVVLGLWFLDRAGDFHEIALRHSPEVTPSEDVGEGFAVIGLGAGYKAAYVLQVAALCSALLSMLPFKFNERIERAVDDTIDHGIEDVRALGSKVSEWNVQHFGHGQRHSRQSGAGHATPPPLPDQDAENPEDPRRFMPG